MSSFFNAIESSGIWRGFFSHFAWIDWVFFFAMMYFVALGIQHGMGFLLTRIIEVLLVILTVFTFYPPVSDMLVALIASFPKIYADLFSFLVFGVLFWFIFYTISRKLEESFKLHANAFVRAFGGALFGAFYGLIILSLAVQFFLLLPSDKLHKSFEKNTSVSGYFLSQFVPNIYKSMTWPVKQFQGNQK